MIESKKGLRIAAGVLLLVFGVILPMATVISRLPELELTIPQFFSTFWLSIITWVLDLLVAIFILTRKFTGAAIVLCVSLGFSLLGVISQITVISNASKYGTYLALQMISTLVLGIPALILQIIALFMHRRASGTLLIIAAVIGFVQAVASPIITTMLPGAELSAKTMVSCLPSILYALGWLFLGIYFRGQTDGVRRQQGMYGTDWQEENRWQP